jgi:hypothetical protein
LSLLPPPSPRAAPFLYVSPGATRGGPMLLTQPSPRGAPPQLITPTSRNALATAPTRGGPIQLAMASSRGVPGHDAGKPVKAEPIRLAALPRPPGRIEQGDAGRGAEPKGKATLVKLPTPPAPPAKPKK